MNCLEAIMRASRVETASGLRQHPRKSELIESDQGQRKNAREVGNCYWNISQRRLRVLVCFFTVYRHHLDQEYQLASASQQSIRIDLSTLLRLKVNVRLRLCPNQAQFGARIFGELPAFDVWSGYGQQSHQRYGQWLCQSVKSLSRLEQ